MIFILYTMQNVAVVYITLLAAAKTRGDTKLGVVLFDPLLYEANINKKKLNELSKLSLRTNQNSQNLSKVSCHGYDYDSTVCKEIKDRLICGYNKNKGDIDEGKPQDMGNDCKLRNNRLECGYDNNRNSRDSSSTNTNKMKLLYTKKEITLNSSESTVTSLNDNRTSATVLSTETVTTTTTTTNKQNSTGKVCKIRGNRLECGYNINGSFVTSSTSIAISLTKRSTTTNITTHRTNEVHQNTSSTNTMRRAKKIPISHKLMSIFKNSKSNGANEKYSEIFMNHTSSDTPYPSKVTMTRFRAPDSSTVTNASSATKTNNNNPNTSTPTKPETHCVDKETHIFCYTL